jgi:hypothetical protein
MNYVMVNCYIPGAAVYSLKIYYLKPAFVKKNCNQTILKIVFGTAYKLYQLFSHNT